MRRGPNRALAQILIHAGPAKRLSYARFCSSALVTRKRPTGLAATVGIVTRYEAGWRNHPACGPRAGEHKAGSDGQSFLSSLGHSFVRITRSRSQHADVQLAVDPHTTRHKVRNRTRAGRAVSPIGRAEKVWPLELEMASNVAISTSAASWFCTLNDATTGRSWPPVHRGPYCETHAD